MQTRRKVQGLILVIAFVAVHDIAIGQERDQGSAQPSARSRETLATFTGHKSSWHGFDRFDFVMDQSSFAIQPIDAPADEGTGINGNGDGQLRCVVVAPKVAAADKPWSWRGRYFDHEPQAEIELLKRGFHIGFVQSDEPKAWDAWYAFLTERHGFSKKPAFVGMSGGGRNAFTWATSHPDKATCIYADNPLITRESLAKLGDLAQRDVPLLHICGSLDPLSGNHTFPIESIYQQLGGRISVMIKDGTGHHPHSLRDPTIIVDFVVASLAQAHPVPAFVGQKFTKTSFYSIGDRYLEFPKESLWITCRGPMFSPSYDRYEFKPETTTGTAIVIAPRKAAEGRPWVLRADLARRDDVVELALLEKGFHIVTAPRPRDPAVTLMEEWNALYRFLVDQGFSPKPVLEANAGAAVEAYAWAIENPTKVSCLYGANPILRSDMSKTPPLDNLTPLANSGVNILHVCGSLDPWLESQTRVAQERYQKLGGKVRVIIKEGEGHYPLAPKDPQPVVDFIITNTMAVIK